MKKTKLMRAALLLLVLTLITSCFVGGTFAKYVVKSKTAVNQARVAKFGVEVTAEGDMFSHSYATDDNTVTTIAESVVSSETDPETPISYNVVAPGTKGALGGITITGTPEVAVKVTYDGFFALGGDRTRWSANGQYYCPLQITIKGTDVEDQVIKGTDYKTAYEFEAAVSDAIAGYSKVYPANTDLSKMGGDSIAISWEWPFNGNDTKDTALGNWINGETWAPPQITLNLTAAVTQID